MVRLFVQDTRWVVSTFTDVTKEDRETTCTEITIQVSCSQGLIDSDNVKIRYSLRPMT